MKKKIEKPIEEMPVVKMSKVDIAACILGIIVFAALFANAYFTHVKNLAEKERITPICEKLKDVAGAQEYDVYIMDRVYDTKIATCRLTYYNEECYNVDNKSICKQHVTERKYFTSDMM